MLIQRYTPTAWFKLLTFYELMPLKRKQVGILLLPQSLDAPVTWGQANCFKCISKQPHEQIIMSLSAEGVGYYFKQKDKAIFPQKLFYRKKMLCVEDESNALVENYTRSSKNFHFPRYYNDFLSCRSPYFIMTIISSFAVIPLSFIYLFVLKNKRNDHYLLPFLHNNIDPMIQVSPENKCKLRGTRNNANVLLPLPSKTRCGESVYLA